MLPRKPLYYLETVADVIVRQVSSLGVRHRACGAQSDVVPVDVCLQGIIDERGLLVLLIYKFAVE